jgi:serine/threonine protein kinase
VIGPTIGNYEVQRLIGEGGMGKVYLAIHRGLGRVAAVKLLGAHDWRDSEAVGRFLTEARTANAIRHENIVDIYDSGMVENAGPYIIMEHLEGQSLTQALSHGPVALDDLTDWGCQIADALTAAHDNYVIHRDLKPDNLFLVPDPRRPGKRQVKVMDFGIAKLQGAEQQGYRTQPGGLLGTPLYMSPEQCTSQKDLDARSDIYSFGVILYEMATGRRPFDADSFYALMSMHISDPPSPPTTYRKDLPRAIEDIILQALAKAPADRQGSMAEVLSQLELARGNVAASAEALKRSSSLRSRTTARAATFGRQKILAFLRDIDGKLDRPAGMEIIGGAAALLAYGAQSPTKDIVLSVDDSIPRAAESATRPVPIHRADVPVPTGHEDSRERLVPGFRNLVVWVPSRYHLLLMKAVRASRRDVDVIVEMHRAFPFDLEVIVERSNEQSPRAFGNLETLAHVGLLVEKLFGPNRVHRVGSLTMRRDFLPTVGRTRFEPP